MVPSGTESGSAADAVVLWDCEALALATVAKDSVVEDTADVAADDSAVEDTADVTGDTAELEVTLDVALDDSPLAVDTGKVSAGKDGETPTVCPPMTSAQLAGSLPPKPSTHPRNVSAVADGSENVSAMFEGPSTSVMVKGVPSVTPLRA